MTKESELQTRIQARATDLGCRLFRNTVGIATLGTPVRITDTRNVLLHAGDVVVRNGRIVDVGLPVGSGDLIGWIPTIIAGSPLAVFTSVEVKTRTGRVREQQEQWRAHVDQAGGAAIIARSVADFDALAHTVL